MGFHAHLVTEAVWVESIPSLYIHIPVRMIPPHISAEIITAVRRLLALTVITTIWHRNAKFPSREMVYRRLIPSLKDATIAGTYSR